MKKPLFIICGPSASGKTTLADSLERNYGFKRARSYTSRPRRADEPRDAYHFTTPGGISQLPLIERTNYAGYNYGLTRTELRGADLVVVETDGVRALRKVCGDMKQPRPCYVILLEASRKVRVERMVARGDSSDAIEKRLARDESSFKAENINPDLIVTHTEREAVLQAVLQFISEKCVVLRAEVSTKHKSGK